MFPLTRSQILEKFRLVGIPVHPEGATRDELRAIDAVDHRAGYLQYVVDYLVAQQSGDTSTHDWSPATVMHDWDKMPGRWVWDRFYNEALGYRPYGPDERPVSVPESPAAHPIEPEKPPLTPEEQEAKAAHDRELTRERVRRFRARRAEEDRQSRIDAREAKIEHHKQVQQDFGREYAGTHESDPLKPTPPEPFGVGLDLGKWQ